MKSLPARMSSSTKLSTDQSLIRRFLDQPAELAAPVRAALLAEGESILLYVWDSGQLFVASDLLQESLSA